MGEATGSATKLCLADLQQRLDGDTKALVADFDLRQGNSDAQALLAASQSAWVAYRDAECAFSSSGVAGGRVYPIIYALCQTNMTETRLETLKRYQSCVEGDMGCPVPEQ
ncbi:MAG: lysozyme inhibitor LprI family protein [Pseudomonadota bacterium]